MHVISSCCKIAIKVKYLHKRFSVKLSIIVSSIVPVHGHSVSTSLSILICAKTQQTFSSILVCVLICEMAGKQGECLWSC